MFILYESILNTYLDKSAKNRWNLFVYWLCHECKSFFNSIAQYFQYMLANFGYTQNFESIFFISSLLNNIQIHIKYQQARSIRLIYKFLIWFGKHNSWIKLFKTLTKFNWKLREYFSWEVINARICWISVPPKLSVIMPMTKVSKLIKNFDVLLQ